MTVDVYEAQLDGSEQIDITAGDVALTCTFKWNDAVQEQYDLLALKMDAVRDGDPLMSKDGVIDRTYDLLDYYHSIPNNISSWLDTNPSLPVTLQSYESDRDLYISKLTERKETYGALYDWRAALKEGLVWQVTITDANNALTVADVRNGGVVRGENLDYFITFLSPDEDIGRDRLAQVTMRVEVVTA